MEAKLAEKSLLTLQIDEAEQHLERIKAIDPDYNLNALDSLKAQAMSKKQEIEELTRKAEVLLEKPYKKPGWFESHKEQRKLLTSTYHVIEQIRQTNPNDPRIQQLLSRLDQKYASIVSSLMQDGDSDVRDYVEDTLPFEWQSPELDRLRDTLY